MTKKQDQHAAFKTWLQERGAVLEAPTSEWEILRFRDAEGLHVVHRNAKGVESWPTRAAEVRAQFAAGAFPKLSPTGAKRSNKVRKYAEALGERDGLECWFCALRFEDARDWKITIEHLVGVAHGGPNHVSNLVLACKPCNEEAGILSVAEKVALRDRKRGRA